MQEPWGCLVYRVEININDQLIANPYHLYGQYLKDYNLDPKIKPCVDASSPFKQYDSLFDVSKENDDETILMDMIDQSDGNETNNNDHERYVDQCEYTKVKMKNVENKIKEFPILLQWIRKSYSNVEMRHAIKEYNNNQSSNENVMSCSDQYFTIMRQYT